MGEAKLKKSRGVKKAQRHCSNCRHATRHVTGGWYRQCTLKNKRTSEMDTCNEHGFHKVALDFTDLDGMETRHFKIHSVNRNTCAWIRNKGDGRDHYLSTHTFYESTYKRAQKMLNKLGFEVDLRSWG